MIYDLRLTPPALRMRSPRAVLVLAGLLLAGSMATAFPPAPHHVIHGMVRDEQGQPLSLSSAQVFLETTNGISIACTVSPEIEPGENYRLIVPMDSFTSPAPYKSAALKATVPFRMRVKIGQTIYLPIEMAGDFSQLGKPAGNTLINLTLGVDADGDGLPDAWENTLIQMLGGGLTLADIRAGGDEDGDGLSNYQEYIAGTYAFDPQDGLKLSLVRRNGQGPVVQFFAVAGRTYSVESSTNLLNWSPMQIRFPGDTNTPGSAEFYSPASQIIETEVLLPPGQTRGMLFRVRVH